MLVPTLIAILFQAVWFPEKKIFVLLWGGGAFLIIALIEIPFFILSGDFIISYVFVAPVFEELYKYLLLHYGSKLKIFKNFATPICICTFLIWENFFYILSYFPEASETGFLVAPLFVLLFQRFIVSIMHVSTILLLIKLPNWQFAIFISILVHASFNFTSHALLS